MEPTQAAEVEPATPRSGSTTRRSTLIRAAIVCLPRNRTWSDDDLERHVFFIQALYCHLVANALVGLYELVAGTTMAATVAVGAIGASAGTALALTRRGWPIHLLASGHLLIFLAVLTWSIQAGAAAPGAHVLLYFAFVPIAAAFLIGPHGAIAFGLITAAAFAFLATTTDSGALRGARGWFESIVPLACISAFGWVTERLRHRSAARLQLALAARRQAEEEALNAHRDLEAQVEERIRLEAELVQAQKLEAIGQLAAGIAHEVNTPTQYVGDNLDFLREAFDDTVEALLKYRELHQICSQQAPTRELLAEIDQVVEAADLDFLLKEIPGSIEQAREGVKRVSEIVLAMKTFSHPGGKGKTLLDLNHALQSTATVSRSEWKYVAEMETRFDPSLPRVFCYPGELNQVFLNLIVNAAHAIADAVGDGAQGKGTITLTTRSEADGVVVEVADNGSSIPEEVRGRIFEPFFTTKGVGKGTGQGLAIAYSVVTDKHAGRIEVESQLGEGTCFRIWLPSEEACDPDPNANPEAIG